MRLEEALPERDAAGDGWDQESVVIPPHPLGADLDSAALITALDLAVASAISGSASESSKLVVQWLHVDGGVDNDGDVEDSVDSEPSPILVLSESRRAGEKLESQLPALFAALSAKSSKESPSSAPSSTGRAPSMTIESRGVFGSLGAGEGV